MYRLKRLASICLFVFISSALYAQGGNAPLFKKCPVNSINYEQGLLNNETTSVATDPLGFTWLSTYIGLQRYNGYTLENINPVINKDTVKIETPVYLYNLQNGHLWISCKKGVIEYDSKANKFKNVIPLFSTSGVFYSILPINETSRGIWCLQEDKGIVLYSNDGRLQKVDHSIPVDVVKHLFNADALLAKGNKDYIFVLTAAREMVEINTTSGKMVATRLANEDILGISCNENSVYVNTTVGIYHYLIDGWKLLNKCSFKGITDQPVTFSNTVAITPDRLVVNVNNQFLEYNAGLSSYKIFTSFSGEPIVSTGVIEHIYYDKFERIWLLTNDDIKRIQDREIPFAYFRYPASTNNFVRSLYFDKEKNQLLAGCLNGGLQLYDTLANPLWKEPLITKDVKDILSIEKLTADTYLIITWARGWYILDVPKRKLSNFTFLPGSPYQQYLYQNTFTCNTQRINDSTIFITAPANVFRCVFYKNSLRSVNPMFPFNKINDRIHCCLYASNGTLWAGCFKGSIYKIDKKGAFQMIHLPTDIAIRCIKEDNEHHIWIGSNSGLYIYDASGRLLNRFLKSSGLLNDCIYSILPMDNAPAVFVGSNLGLSSVSLNGTIKNYTKELGLQDNEFNSNSALKTADGKFYFGGVSGISAFYPSGLTELKNKPVLNITRLVINDSCYNSSAGIWKGDTINLKYNQNHLQVDFAAMGLLNADKYLYKYRLLGFEHRWQSTHLATGIRYILGTGKYLMQISCINTLSGRGANKELVIIVHPPWWYTWWFLLIMGISVIGILILAISFYNKRKYQKKLQELTLKQSLQSQRERISRDLHDNLGAQASAMFYGTELLRQKDKNVPAIIDNLHDTAVDMLTVLRETLWAMRVNEVEATDVWLRVLNFVKKMSAYYNEITLDVNGDPPADKTINASMALNLVLIVQEAINNSVRHANASGIVVSSYASNGTWRIEIADNGMGFDLSETKRKAESYGLENMANRAKESHILFVINSLPSHGTTVSLEVTL